VSLNWILALLSAVLMVALFPGYGHAWLAPVALAPLVFAAARADSWRWRFALGYASGVLYWFGLCNWIQWTLAHHAGVSDVVAWLLFALFCLAKAVQTGIFAALAGPLTKRAWGPPAIAALWVALDYTHAWTAFEWLQLGNAAADMSLLLRLAPFTGAWGISFVFALMGAVVAVILLRRRRLASAWLLALLGLYALPDVMPEQRGDQVAVAVQPNLDDETVWSSELLAQTERQLTMLSVSPVVTRGGADLIVWPEMPAPFYDTDPEFRQFLTTVAATARTDLLTGVVARAASGAPLNSALLVDSAGTTLTRYDKVNLVPFGEFVPWPFGLVTSKVSSEAGDFEAGRNVIVSKLDGSTIGTFICYESVFPGYIRKFAANGAQALFNISNDSWFGKSSARYQHLQIVRMRAAENQRWIVRVTNNGVTASIDPAGRIRQAAPEYREASTRLQFGWRQNLTLYTQYGDWFVALCALAAASAVIAAAYLPLYSDSSRR
jgi:apolipoprotein N-acyltransferase